MKPEQKTAKWGSTVWNNWRNGSTGEKIGSVGIVLIVLAFHVFFNYVLPQLVKNEGKAGGISRPVSSIPAPNLQIPRPDVRIPPNPNINP